MRPAAGRRGALRCSCAVLVVLAASCASATKRFEQGQELEQQGRPADAAHRYVDALRKDPTLTDARARLLETGSGAVADDIRAADAFETTAAYTEAADALRTADALVRDAAGVGVALDVPPGYVERRGATFGRAVDQALAQASVATQRGDYAESVRLVERAQERWEPRSDQQSALNRVLQDTHVTWGQRELSSGHYRAAFAHGETASNVPGLDRSASSALQSEALRRGTVLVAVFPAGARSGTDGRILPEVNDLLALDFWQHPPQWIDVVNPIEAQRVVRIRGLAGRDIDAQNAAALGRQLGARYAVALTLDSVRYAESKVERRRRSARTRAGVDTAFTVEEGELELWARVGWRQVEVTGGRAVIEHGDASDRATTQFRRPTYAGNWRDLDLNPADRTLFEQRDARDNQDMLRRVARGLADKLGRDVYDALLRRVD